MDPMLELASVSWLFVCESSALDRRFESSQMQVFPVDSGESALRLGH